MTDPHFSFLEIQALSPPYFFPFFGRDLALKFES